MPKTDAEKREYSRGYQRGTARLRDYAYYAFDMAKAYRSRLKDAQAVAFGSMNWLSRECATCERWTRGQPGTCKWGICSADFEAAVGEPMMWTGEPPSSIYTHENFGCCNHLQGNPLRKKLVGNEKTTPLTP